MSLENHWETVNASIPENDFDDGSGQLDAPSVVR
jgi:hypothetical protein